MLSNTLSSPLGKLVDMLLVEVITYTVSQQTAK
ncbi:Uncharacterised protein [Serratia quinivorans]|nr:Uncharacterised protein [Serratia quinivorans]CAI1605544.1 Uncharacterised protein [Serratia quinivorans]